MNTVDALFDIAIKLTIIVTAVAVVHALIVLGAQ